MAKRSGWLEVDPDGLAQLIGDRGKEFIIYELLQNAWDEASTRVDVEFLPQDRGVYIITVTDDNPEGFKDISHAFTLFAPSMKKDDPEKRGRFNLGEKLVLALAHEANIRTTKGSILFQSDGTRIKAKASTVKGSVITLYIRMNRQEYDAAMKAVWNVIPPSHIKTTINGRELVRPSATTSFDAVLPTVVSDPVGIMRPTRRGTNVEIFNEIGRGNGTWIYEMGIPVVRTNDAWSYNVHQKVPLNSERTDVTPAYKQDIRVEVLNRLFPQVIGAAAATMQWVRDAAADPNVHHDAVEHVMTQRFGEKRVIFDTSDPEANKIAMSQGYTVIHGGSMSRDEWANVRNAGAALPSGQVTPSPKPFHPDGTALKVIKYQDWTKPMKRFANFVTEVSGLLIGTKVVSVTFADDVEWGVRASFGVSLELHINWATECGIINQMFMHDGKTTGMEFVVKPVVDLLIHELSHYTQHDHLSTNYYRELTRLGGAFTALALARPDWFNNPSLWDSY